MVPRVSQRTRVHHYTIGLIANCINLNSFFFRCEFVLQTFGPEVIKSITEKYPNLPRPSIKNPVDFRPGLQMLKNNLNGENIFESFFKSSIVTGVISMGFSRQQIETLAKRKFNEDGRIFQTTESLLEELLASENQGIENGENNTNTMSSNSMLGQQSCRMQANGFRLPSGITLNTRRAVEADGTAPTDNEFQDSTVIDCLCSSCKQRVADVLCMPCFHLASCESCTINGKCPKCHGNVDNTMKVYLS